MDASGSVFSQTLQTITTTKLEELAKQRETFEKQYADLIAASGEQPDQLKRLFLLVDGAKTALGIQTVQSKGNKTAQGRVIVGGTSNTRLETDLKNLDRFLDQARYDPSVSPKVMEEWEKLILQYLSIQSAKYQYADLYGKLVTEWLSSEKKTQSDGDVEMTESFEEIPGAKKLAAREEWEKVVFEPAQINVHGLKDYLQTLFITDKKKAAKAISDVRESVEAFEGILGNSHQFNVPTLKLMIQGLQRSDLLNNEKREVLKDFLSNEVILAEIADVLNMRMGALSRWTWGDHVPLEQRRKVSGGYSIHMHEDLLQAIFLHYIGTKWSVFFRNVFAGFRGDAWKTNHVVVPKVDRRRREYYLGPSAGELYPNLEDKRASTHRGRYFAYQLLDHENQQVEMQEGEEEAEYTDLDGIMPRKRSKQTASLSVARPKQTARVGMQMPQQGPARMQMASKAARRTVNYSSVDYSDEDDEDDEDDDTRVKRPMEVKQKLLHLLSTEIVLNSRLYGELTCFRSVFESWNPLLPHDTILTVLEFLGVSDKWLTFFKKFLQAPLKFTDDQSGATRLRRRGTPGSHALSDVFGEVVFSCLDFSVNQATDGGMLYRLYDDVWFWSKDYEKCAQAWSSVEQFAKAMGVDINYNKTGSVRIAGDTKLKLEIDDRLPKGEIRWGFLYLDSITGRFEIDEKMVDGHIDELRTQLQGKSKSIIDWIQAWNTYATTFISSNFGKAANCFGREHVDKMLSTHRRVQDRIFEGGNVVQFLKATIEKRFNVKNIPDGFLFFPIELGGLDLKSSFVGLLQIRESVKEDPFNILDFFKELEREDYATAKTEFERGDVRSSRVNGEDPKFVPEDPDVFLSFEEYVRYREEFRCHKRADIINVYNALMKQPVQESIDVSAKVKQAIEQLRGQNNLKGITGDWVAMEAYWKWVAQMYGPEMVERFGGLNVVEFGLLPIGMVSMFREKRIKWQG